MISTSSYDLGFYNTSGNETPLISARRWSPSVVSTYVTSVCFILTAFLAFVGNFVTLLAFFLDRKLLRKNFNLLILNLTLADLFVALLDLPFQAVHNQLGYWPFGVVACALLIFCDWAMTFVSIFTLVAISIDRYWAACYAQAYKIHNTRKRTLICIAFIWCFLLLTWLPAFIVDRINADKRDSCNCYFSVQKNNAYIMYLIIAGYHLPSCLMFFCNVRIYLAVRQARSRIEPAPTDLLSPKQSKQKPIPVEEIERWRDGNAPSTSRGNNHETVLATISKTVAARGCNPFHRKTRSRYDEKEARIFRSLSYIITAYLVLWTPIHIVGDIKFYREDLVSADVYNYVSILCYFNSAVNPFLYAASCEHIRHAMCRVLCCNRP